MGKSEPNVTKYGVVSNVHANILTPYTFTTHVHAVLERQWSN